MKFTWTEEKIQFVIENKDKMTTRDFCKYFNIHSSTVLRLARKLQIKIKQYVPNEISEDVKQFIRDNYQTMTVHELAEHCGVSYHCMKSRIFKLGLKGKINKTCFKKGNIPWNKDIKGLHHSPATEYKKGQLPLNTKYDGCITVRRHNRDGATLWIRIAQQKWTYLSRYVWEVHFGKLPKGYVVRFIDGNPFNCDVDNLIAVPRSQHLTINSDNKNNDSCIANFIVGKMPNKEIKRKLANKVKQFPDLLNLKRTQLKLKREINECTK